MLTIYKFPIASQDEQVIPMQKGAELLCLQVQNDFPCIWALVDIQAAKVRRKFRVYGDGHPIGNLEPSCLYVGTYQLNFGSLVFHVFDGGEC